MEESGTSGNSRWGSEGPTETARESEHVSSQTAERIEVTRDLHNSSQSSTQRDASPVICSFWQSNDKGHSDAALLLHAYTLTASLHVSPEHHPHTARPPRRSPEDSQKRPRDKAPHPRLALKTENKSRLFQCECYACRRKPDFTCTVFILILRAEQPHFPKDCNVTEKLG